MKDSQLRDFCLALMKADTEEEVIALLKDAGYWNDSTVWRFYGDRDTNYNAIGNQQSLLLHICPQSLPVASCYTLCERNLRDSIGYQAQA